MKITLTEAIYGGLATLFHRSKTADRTAFRVAVGKKRTAISIFGGGFYTTYDLEDQLKDRMVRNYGEYIFKIVARVDRFFVFDKKIRDKMLRHYTKNQQEAIDKIEQIVADDEEFNHWKDDGWLIYVINKYSEVEDLIRDNFEGMIYLSKDDGRCALIFNPAKSYVKVVAVAHVPDWNTDQSTIEWKKV